MTERVVAPLAVAETTRMSGDMLPDTQVSEIEPAPRCPRASTIPDSATERTYVPVEPVSPDNPLIRQVVPDTSATLTPLVIRLAPPLRVRVRSR